MLQQHFRKRPFLREGAILVEFAIISLVLYLLLAAIITFGHLLYVAQGGQQIVDFTAREISRTPLPLLISGDDESGDNEELSLDDVLYGDANSDERLESVRKELFDPHYLVLNLDTNHGKSSLQELTESLPSVNQLLIPYMIVDRIDGTKVLRYPGAVFRDNYVDDDPTAPSPSGWLVSVPVYSSENTYDLVPVFEEVPFADGDEPFKVFEGNGQGVVSLRMNYPYQSAVMSGFDQPDSPFDPTIGSVKSAEAITINEIRDRLILQNVTVIKSDNPFGPQAGSYGLGKQAAFAKEVRPFRRVITLQAAYRREIFSTETE
ncbi:MAG: pilus assembly protein [Pirellulaceae bacterium]|nr:pilus assembly protein [Pirellulaceae bacterium]